MYMVQTPGYLSVPTNKEAETAGLQHQCHRTIIWQLHKIAFAQTVHRY